MDLPDAKRPKLSIPSLKGELLAMIGRMDSDAHIMDLAFNIGGQDSLSGAVWDQISDLLTVEPIISRENFIRMWKTIILKRLVDVFSKEKGRRHNHYIRLDYSIIVPRPLGELLYSIGQFRNLHNGITYDVVPPTQSAQPEPWWTVDNTILNQWIRFINRVSFLYEMLEMPKVTEFRDRPINMLNLADTAGGLRTVRSYTTGPTPSDGLLFFVNDDLFTNHAASYDNCHLIVTEARTLQAVRDSYVGSYVKQTTA